MEVCAQRMVKKQHYFNAIPEIKSKSSDNLAMTCYLIRVFMFVLAMTIKVRFIG
jgi:hypothetical protein